MRHQPARVVALLVAALLLSSSGCSWFHHGKNSKRCREPAVGGEVKDMPPLKVPSGLDAPDTRNAIKVPPLNEPERPRSPGEPCLSAPPSFKT